MGGERRGEKEFGPPEGRWDVVRETFRAHVSSVRKIGVHRIVWLLSVTRHEDSAWCHHLLVILWHLNSNRCWRLNVRGHGYGRRVANGLQWQRNGRRELSPVTARLISAVALGLSATLPIDCARLQPSRAALSAAARTSLADQGCEFSDLAQYFYASVQRGERMLLEERGVLPHREKHKNGAEWLFWAEEANSSASR